MYFDPTLADVNVRNVQT